MFLTIIYIHYYAAIFNFPPLSLSLLLLLPPSSAAASKEKRAPSAYNVFMRTEVEKVKKANPSLKPAEAFKAAALNVI